MRLLTAAIVASLPGLGAQERLGEQAPAVVKFFNPCGAGTWWATEGAVQFEVDGETQELPLKDYCERFGLNAAQLEERVARAVRVYVDRVGPGDVDVLFFGAAHIHEFEYGYFRLSELLTFRAPRLGLGIERDLYWRERPIIECNPEFVRAS